MFATLIHHGNPKANRNGYAGPIRSIANRKCGVGRISSGFRPYDRIACPGGDSRPWRPPYCAASAAFASVYRW